MIVSQIFIFQAIQLDEKNRIILHALLTQVLRKLLQKWGV